jgi:2-dehydro-3-deoxyphosphogluconate aldolase/(4S)-4-hydroxy-2-oxoglutarate aldolase
MAFEGTRPGLPSGLEDGGVVAIARRLGGERLEAIADGLLGGGVRAFEVTLNEPEATALEAIRIVARHAEGTSLAIGAGTVLTIEAAARALDAGARFLVMPHTDHELIGWAAARGVPSFPGAMTPTEILTAWRAGAAAVKLFPASVVGPTFIREFRGPFPDIPLVPTGGVTIDSIGPLVRAGASAVGLGTWLLGEGDPAGIAERGAQAVAAVAGARAAR